MQFSFSTMQPAYSPVNQLCKYMRLTSSSFEFPNFTWLRTNQNDQIALILYYAHVMDQKKLLNDFYRLYKRSLESKYESSTLEMTMKTWILHSIVKLLRRCELIMSDDVSTWKTQMICAISQVLFDIFCDLLGASSKKVMNIDLYNGSNKQKSNFVAYNENLKTLFAGSRLSSSVFYRFNDFYKDVGVGQLFGGVLFKKNTKQLNISKSSMQWLKRFWLEFCYQPDPTNRINSLQYKCKDINKTSNFDQISQNVFSSPHCYDDDISSKEDSDSSGSWSCKDFADEIPYKEDSFISESAILDKCNATLKWLSLTSVNFPIESSYSDGESVIFGDVITEENCMDRAGTKGSLCFVDVDYSDEEDDFEVIFSNTSTTSFPIDYFEDGSQGYANPCFEDMFTSFSVPSFMRSVNDSWSEMMLDIEDKPRQPSKVSFAPEPSLVTVHVFEKTKENSDDASLVLDRLRFQYRTKELGRILTPFLTRKHRLEIQRRNGFYQD